MNNSILFKNVATVAANEKNRQRDELAIETKILKTQGLRVIKNHDIISLHFLI